MILELYKKHSNIIHQAIQRGNVNKQESILQFKKYIVEHAVISKTNDHVSINTVECRKIFNSLAILSCNEFININNESATYVFDFCNSTFKAKNNDYGNSFLDFGTIGIIIRINDKLNRIESLMNTKEHKGMVSNESILDNYLDLLNYSIIGLICLDMDSIL